MEGKSGKNGKNGASSRRRKIRKTASIPISLISGSLNGMNREPQFRGAELWMSRGKQLRYRFKLFP